MTRFLAYKAPKACEESNNLPYPAMGGNKIWSWLYLSAVSLNELFGSAFQKIPQRKWLKPILQIQRYKQICKISYQHLPLILTSKNKEKKLKKSSLQKP